MTRRFSSQAKGQGVRFPLSQRSACIWPQINTLACQVLSAARPGSRAFTGSPQRLKDEGPRGPVIAKDNCRKVEDCDDKFRVSQSMTQSALCCQFKVSFFCNMNVGQGLELLRNDLSPHFVFKCRTKICFLSAADVWEHYFTSCWETVGSTFSQ